MFVFRQRGVGGIGGVFPGVALASGYGVGLCCRTGEYKVDGDRTVSAVDAMESLCVQAGSVENGIAPGVGASAVLLFGNINIV